MAVAAPSSLYQELARESRRRHGERFAAGEPPPPDALSGWEYRGYNASPRVVALIGIRKFIKGFLPPEDGEPAYGYNTPARQNELDQEWAPKPSEERAKRFGFYELVPEPGDGKHGLLLDYGRGDNPRLAIYKGLRDYLVRVEPGSDDVLLGKACFAFGGPELHLGFFVLERWRPTR